MPSEPRIQIEARVGSHPGPAKRLEKWVNKKVAIGKPLPFPDFHDVLRCVREANEEDRLGWNEVDIMEEARDLFVRCGKKLQRRRQENEWRVAASRISHDVSSVDPAEKSADLKKKLEDNKTVAAKKEIELLNKYADKQNQLKLVGEEIGDKEAEESPVESEDDDGNDESDSLEDKQKRKERLKRLLHEKTRKMSSERENVTNEAEVNKEVKNVEEKEEKMEYETENVESKKEDLQVVVVEPESNNSIINISEDGPSNEQKKQKTDDSDPYDVDSDIDELHLLQKLYSENEINSSTEESDSDTPIAISDTLESDSDNENTGTQQNYDIISIENSSYSESEVEEAGGDTARILEGAKDKHIDGSLHQNEEVLMLSSMSTADKMDVDEENILLASSEEEHDIDSNLYASNTEGDACGVKSPNDGSANDDCEVITDNCENDIEMYEVPFNVEKINEVITPHKSESNTLENSEDDLKFIEDISQDSKKLLENYVKKDNLTKIFVPEQENQDNLESVKSNNIANDVECSEANCVNNEVVFENETKNNVVFDNCQGEENNSLKKIIKNTFNDDACLESNIMEGKEVSVSTCIKADGTKQDFNECKVMDVNVEIPTGDSSLTN